MKLDKLESTLEPKKKKRVGRGPGSGRGTFAGRGIKGQKSRAGYKIPSSSTLIGKLPKLRGEGSIKVKRVETKTVNLGDLEKYYKNNETVSAESLIKKGLIRPKKSNRKIKIKVLGDGELTKNLKFPEDILYSQKALEKIQSKKQSSKKGSKE